MYAGSSAPPTRGRSVQWRGRSVQLARPVRQMRRKKDGRASERTDRAPRPCSASVPRTEQHGDGVAAAIRVDASVCPALRSGGAHRCCQPPCELQPPAPPGALKWCGGCPGARGPPDRCDPPGGGGPPGWCCEYSDPPPGGPPRYPGGIVLLALLPKDSYPPEGMSRYLFCGM